MVCLCIKHVKVYSQVPKYLDVDMIIFYVYHRILANEINY